MNGTRTFFIFVAMLAACSVAFGLYVNTLKSCEEAAKAASSFTEGDCHRLYLAFGVLFAVVVMLALGAAFYALLPAPAANAKNPGEQIFDSFIKMFTPIITLVLGDYFGSTNASQTPEEPRPEPAKVQQKADNKGDAERPTKQEKAGQAGNPGAASQAPASRP